MDACGFCFSFCQRSFQAVPPRYKPLSYVDLPLGLSEKARSTLQCPTEFGQLSFQIQVSTVSLRYKANIIRVPNGPNIFSKWHGMRWAYMVFQAFGPPKERFNLKKMKCHVAFALVSLGQSDQLDQLDMVTACHETWTSRRSISFSENSD